MRRISVADRRTVRQSGGNGRNSETDTAVVVLCGGCDISTLGEKRRERERDRMKRADTVASPSERQRRARFAAGHSPVDRLEDYLGDRPARIRYRIRCRSEYRCPDCGQPLPVGPYRVRCPRCAEKRAHRKHHARALTLWCHGADLHAVARLVIGPTRSPRRRYRAADPLDIRCRRCDTVFADVQWHGERCRCCGADLWGTSVEKSVRKKWIRATDAERMAGLVG